MIECRVDGCPVFGDPFPQRHRCITIVVDHDSGKLVWAAPGRDRKTLAGFFKQLGESHCVAITLVSADAVKPGTLPATAN